MRIGLPRALGYYEYGLLWRTFFEALGAEAIVSRSTTRATLEVGTSRAAADLCLPAKVYVGHLLALASEVDMVFVPSLCRPAPAATHCATIIGLPDLARSVLPDPSLVLAVDIDLDKGSLALAQAVWAAARPLTWNPVQIARAAETAWAMHRKNHNHQPSSRRSQDPLTEHRPPRGRSVPLPRDSPPLTLAVVGHPYLLGDVYVNQRLLWRLEQLGARLLTPDMLPKSAAERTVERLTGEAYWAYAPSLVGAGGSFLETGAIDGLVAVISFGCAPDSGLAPVLGQAARRAGVPMLTLTLDEHSGEAGLVTRLEAFVDMLERKHLL
jgi:predicted nucleotide-binding protein (sugar kinase/HSP70/actin superfamily)